MAKCSGKENTASASSASFNGAVQGRAIYMLPFTAKSSSFGKWALTNQAVVLCRRPWQRPVTWSRLQSGERSWTGHRRPQTEVKRRCDPVPKQAPAWHRQGMRCMKLSQAGDAVPISELGVLYRDLPICCRRLTYESIGHEGIGWLLRCHRWLLHVRAESVAWSMQMRTLRARMLQTLGMRTRPRALNLMMRQGWQKRRTLTQNWRTFS